MKKLEKIRELDELIHLIFQEYSPRILGSSFSNRYPETRYISDLFTNSTNFIKTSILDCSETDDLLEVKILFRSQIEHFLRFKFINCTWMKFKDDEASERYLEFTEAREKIDQIKSSIAEHKLSNPSFTVESSKKIFDKILGLKKYTKNEIKQESLKYTYKTIIKTLKDTDKNSSNETPLFRMLIKEHIELSLFIHGGTEAHNQMDIYNDEEKRKNEYLRICRLATLMAATVKNLTLAMIIQTDKGRFLHHLVKLDNLIQELKRI